VKKCRGHQYRRSNQTTRKVRTVQTILRSGHAARPVGHCGHDNRQSRPQALEDRKIQKLVERLDQKLALQAKGAQIQGQAPTAPVPQQGSRLDQSRGFAYLGDRTIQVVPDP